jgi:Cytochrome C assembly protein
LFGIGVFALMPSLDSKAGQVSNVWISLHAALMSLAYGAFGLSSVAALMYLTQEHNLKFHKLQAIFSLLPPIQRLEVVVGRLLLSGFVLLSIGLGIGAYDLAQRSDSGTFRGDPKIVWSALVWLLYLGLVIMRWKYSQTGRRFALGAIGSFAFVLLTFWGSSLLSPLHNPRAPQTGAERGENSSHEVFLCGGFAQARPTGGGNEGRGPCPNAPLRGPVLGCVSGGPGKPPPAYADKVFQPLKNPFRCPSSSSV